MFGNVYKKPVLLSYFFPIIFTVGVILLVMYGLNITDESTKSEGARILEESIWRAVITSYAIEGHYPCDLNHIEENYGIFIDRDKYIVRYSIFASNIKPEVEVVLLEE